MVSFAPRSRTKSVMVMQYPCLGMIAVMKGDCLRCIMNEMLPRSSMNSWVLEAEWDFSRSLVINARAWLRDYGLLLPRYVRILLRYHFSSQALVVVIPPPLTSLDMAPRGHKPSRPPFAQPSHAAKTAIDAAKCYEEYVLNADKAKMFKLEEEVRKIKQFQDDEDVEAPLGGFIPDLGCTRS